MNAKTYKFHAPVGPGGVRCPCCIKKGGLKDAKTRANRSFRRTAKKAAQESA